MQEQPIENFGVVGVVGSEPELRYSDAGKPWLKFRLGVKRPIVAGDWQGDTTTDWYDVIAFGSLAVNASTAIDKKARVSVTGRYSQEEWTDGSGRVNDKIVADGIGIDLRFIDKGEN